MKDETKNTILDAKYARTISAISEMHSIPMEKPSISSTTPKHHALSKKVSPTCTAAATATLRKRSGWNSCRQLCIEYLSNLFCFQLWHITPSEIN